jgi:hypothetical protein
VEKRGFGLNAEDLVCAEGAEARFAESGVRMGGAIRP